MSNVRQVTTMRVLLAAFFVFGSMFGTLGIVESCFRGQPCPWWAMGLPGLAMILAMGISLFVFNGSGYRPSLRRKSLDEQIRELEAKGKLVRQSFRAVRSFSVGEFEDEGSHYYLELADGRVLYLNGQYLCDYEPIDDDPELNRARSFPCSEFEVLRHKDAGYVIHIRCSGPVLEPERVAKPFTRRDFQLGVPEDGQVIDDKSYEQIKAERAAA